MLTGPELGAAIEAARIAKGVSKKKIADDFLVKPPSIQGWVKTGRIDKSKLMDVIHYFADVVGPEHWGLRPGFSFENLPDGPSDAETLEADEAIIPATSAAELVRRMLSTQGKGLSAEARNRLLAAAEADKGGGVIELDYYRPGAMGDEVWIAHYDVRAAMGGGQIPHDYPEMFQDVRVSPQHLREMGVEFKEHFHLKMVTGWGQSMAPTIKHRDPLLVDVSVREFSGDGIYMFSWEGHLYIKRLQWIGDEQISMLSDNPRHPPQTIRADETFIQARVLLVWNAHLV
ncbi:S24 family peptidase [Pseudomonas silesiensis]|uniref:S24 family peptidase n=1 Tax=Pseudomonas silesiensis TaxID=1853130 RepID=UPI0030D308B8